MYIYEVLPGYLLFVQTSDYFRIELRKKKERPCGIGVL
jgi:hypothetical protein